jgi:hypothetical protein
VEWLLSCNADGSDDIERVPGMMEGTREKPNLFSARALPDPTGAMI